MPVTTIKILTDAGAVVILSIALIALAWALLHFTQSRSKNEEAENKRFDKLVDRLVEAFATLQTEIVNIRRVITDNSETQRLVVHATNEQTGEVRLLRAD